MIYPETFKKSLNQSPSADKESFLQVKHDLYYNRGKIEENSNKAIERIASIRKKIYKQTGYI